VKIAYLSGTYFADADFSIIRAMKMKADLYYFIIITPESLRSTAINIQKQYYKSGIFKIDIYPEIGKFFEFFDKEKTYIINICNNKTKCKNLFVFCKLLFMLVRMNIDILHVTYYMQTVMFPLFFLRRKTVLTVHDPIPHSDTRSIRDTIYRKISFKLIKSFVILNKIQRDEFVSKYKLEHKDIHISKLGIYDYLREYIKTMPAKNNIKEKYILFFGRITEYKGLEFLFPAMKIVNETYKDIKLIAAGYCKQYYFDISEYESCSYIDIMNRFIPDDELAILIQNSLFVVCPYIDATQSGAVMSAFAFNVPVLATNVGGLPEYVEHLKSGYVVEPKDVNALADGINCLLGNNGLLDEQRKYIENRYGSGEYSWDKIADDLIAFYKKSVFGRK
jgi:glycosyltransferase involved in cell wall biosynthesis